MVFLSRWGADLFISLILFMVRMMMVLHGPDHVSGLHPDYASGLLSRFSRSERPSSDLGVSPSVGGFAVGAGFADGFAGAVEPAESTGSAGFAVSVGAVVEGAVCGSVLVSDGVGDVVVVADVVPAAPAGVSRLYSGEAACSRSFASRISVSDWMRARVFSCASRMMSEI